MKFNTILLVIILVASHGYCQSAEKKAWKSSVSNVQLFFDSNWELITPYLDTPDKIIVALVDKNDRCGFVIKVTNDVSKKELSDDAYYGAIKEQMLEANNANKLLREDDYVLKKNIYRRLIFSMHTSFGKIYHTVFIRRNGIKMTGIQISYPTRLVNDPSQLPEKTKKLLDAAVF